MLYPSSYNKSSPTFRLEAIVWHDLKPLFYQFFDAMLVAVLVLWDEELFVDKAFQIEEACYILEQEIIQGSKIWTVGWVYYQFFQVPGVYFGLFEFYESFVLTYCRRTCFVLNNAWYFCIHPFQLFKVQVGINGSLVWNELTVNYSPIIPPDAEHPFVFKMQILKNIWFTQAINFQWTAFPPLLLFHYFVPSMSARLF